MPVSRRRSLNALLSGAVIATLLASCGTPTPLNRTQNDASPAIAQTTATGRVTVKITGSAFDKGLKTKQVNFSDPAITQLQLSANGAGVTDPPSKTIAWTPGMDTTMTLDIPVGRNRILTVRALNSDGLAIATLQGVAQVAAGVTTSVQINWFSNTVAQILQIVLEKTPGRLTTLNLQEVEALVRQLTGYDSTANTYTGLDPARIDTRAIGDYIHANGVVPPASAFSTEPTTTLTVVVKDQNGFPLKDVSLKISDPLSAGVANTTDSTTILSDVSPGRWILSVSKDGITRTKDFEISAASGASLTPTVTVNFKGVPTLGSLTVAGATQATAAGLLGRHEGYSDAVLGQALFNRPNALAVNAGETMAYVADSLNHAIRTVNFTNGEVETLCGTGSAGSAGSAGVTVDQDDVQFNRPMDLKLNSAGTELFVADQANSVVRSVDTATGDTTTLAATFSSPTSVALSSSDTLLYVVDSAGVHAFDLDTSTKTTLRSDVSGHRVLYNNNKLYLLNVSQNALYTIDLLDSNALTTRTLSLTGQPFSGSVAGGLAMDPNLANRLLITSAAGNQVYRLNLNDSSLSTAWSTVAGSGEIGYFDGTGTAAQLTGPRDIVTVGSNSYILDSGNNMVRGLDPASGQTMTFGASGGGTVTDGVITNLPDVPVNSVTIDSKRYVLLDGAGGGTGKILVYDLEDSAPITPSALSVGFEIESYNRLVGDSDYLYVSEPDDLWRVTIDGGAVDNLATALTHLGPLALDPIGHMLYLGENKRVARLALDGDTYPTDLINLLGSGADGSTDGLGLVASFGTVDSLLLDPTGTSLYVGSRTNDTTPVHKIRKVQISSAGIEENSASASTFPTTAGAQMGMLFANDGGYLVTLTKGALKSVRSTDGQTALLGGRDL